MPPADFVRGSIPFVVHISTAGLERDHAEREAIAHGSAPLTFRNASRLAASSRVCPPRGPRARGAERDVRGTRCGAFRGIARHAAPRGASSARGRRSSGLVGRVGRRRSRSGSLGVACRRQRRSGNDATALRWNCGRGSVGIGAGGRARAAVGILGSGAPARPLRAAADLSRSAHRLTPRGPSCDGPLRWSLSSDSPAVSSSTRGPYR